MDDLSILNYTMTRYRKRFDDIMNWINDVERKSSTLLAANGVILALSVTLINLLITLHQCIVGDNWDVFSFDGVVLILFYTVYFIQVTCFIASIIFAYKGHGISTFTVPDIKYLNEECNRTCHASEIDILKQEIKELEESKLKLDAVMRRKAVSVDRCQKLFVCGCLSLFVFQTILLISISLGLFN